jgi:hypothetical protein
MFLAVTSLGSVPAAHCSLSEAHGRLSRDGYGVKIGRGIMVYWLHIARAIDRVTLHRDRCSEVPSGVSSSDYWQGGWFDYPDKERALAAMEQAGTSEERKCALCKP